MEARTLGGEAPETQNADSSAKPIYPSPAASQSRTFFPLSELLSPPPRPGAQTGEIGEFRTVL
jgi:hypothetical protein